MMLSLPSFLAAATRASIPPISAADLALAALVVVEPVLVPPHALKRIRAPATMPRRRRPGSQLIYRPPRTGRSWPESRVAEATGIPCSPPFRVGLVCFPPFNHLQNRMSRSGRLSLKYQQWISRLAHTE